MSDLNNISRIAWYYYINNMTQQEIADMMSITRVKVTRAIKKAKDLGIVKITVSTDIRTCIEKELILKDLLNLDNVLIVPSVDDEKIVINSVAVAGAQRLNSILSANDILGVAWGSTIYSVAQHLEELREINGRKIIIVQLLGSMSAVSTVNPDEVAKKVCSKLNGVGHWVNLPVIVNSKEAKDILMSGNYFESSFDLANQCSVAMLGTGCMDNSGWLRKTSILNDEIFEDLVAKGAVGDVSMIYFDINGNIIESELNDMLIATPCDIVRQIPRKIVFAAGNSKVKPIVGAARAKLMNELVTDEVTADKVIEFLK